MKTVKLLFIVSAIFALLAAIACPIFAAMPFAPKVVIAINLGPKNPTFDESQFQDIKFYYTPGLKWTHAKAAGKPALLAKWINKGLLKDEAIVLDKNGKGAFIGLLMQNAELTEARSQGHLDTLGNVLKEIVEENREAPFNETNPLNFNDLSGILGRTFPDFEVADAAGKAFSTGRIIRDAGLPAMIYVYHVPADHKFKSPEESMKNVDTPLQALSGVAGVFQSDEYYGMFKKIELELYGK